MDSDHTINRISSRVDHVESDLRELKVDVHQNVASVNNLQKSVESMSSKLDDLISATGAIQGRSGMIPIQNVHWALGTISGLIAVFLTAVTIASTLIMQAVSSGDALVRAELKVLEERHKNHVEYTTQLRTAEREESQSGWTYSRSGKD